MPRRNHKISSLALETAAILGDRLTHGDVNVRDLCKEIGVSLPTMNRAIKALRAAGFKISAAAWHDCAGPVDVNPGEHWNATGIYSMTSQSAARWRALMTTTVGELCETLGPRAGAVALKGKLAA